MKMVACKKNRVELIQIAVYTFNILFLLLGLIIFGIGLWVKLNVKSMDALMNSRVISNAAVIMIIAGAIVVLVSLFGFYVIKRKLRKWLNIFAICILVIFVLEFSGGLYAFTNRRTARKLLSQGIELTVLHRYRTYGLPKIWSTTLDLIQHGSSSAAMDWIQQHVGCCGSNGPRDWETSSWYVSIGIKGRVQVPISCCIQKAPGCNAGRNLRMLVLNGLIYPKGCKQRADVYLKRYFAAVGKIGLAIAFTQLIGIVLVFILSSVLKKQENKTNAYAQETFLVHAPPPSVAYYPNVNKPIFLTQEGSYCS